MTSSARRIALVAKWAVDINGGRVTVEEGRNGGSVFRIARRLLEQRALATVGPRRV